MILQGSCHCKKVTFSISSATVYPYMHCYCSICRKTAGASGSAINIMGQASSLEVKGAEHLCVYQVQHIESQPGKISPAKRHFCKYCASYLWVSDPRWPQWLYPFASAIDTPLPKPPQRNHIMLDFVASWCIVSQGEKEQHFAKYPAKSIEDWHKDLNLHN